MRRRRLVSRGLLLLLLVSALATLAGAGLLLLERQGRITLRRVPTIWLPLRWDDANDGETIALINTDVVGGSFRLTFPGGGDGLGEERTWIPPRAIVLRRSNKHAQQVNLYHRSSPFPIARSEGWRRSDAPVLLRRGAPTSVETLPDLQLDGAVIALTKRPGVRFVPAAGLTIDPDDVANSGNGFTAVTGEGVRSISVEVSEPNPGAFFVFRNGNRGPGRTFLVFDSDMTVIDQR